MTLRLPEPVLARAGALPTGAGWTFEPKLDGFRCLICTHGGRFLAVSRRGWNMSPLLPELASLPADLQQGVVAKRDRDPYRPGEKLWVKTKNRATERFAEERQRGLAARRTSSVR